MKWLTVLITVVLAFGLTGVATAGSTAQQTITMRVLESTQLTLTGDNNVSITLLNAAATAGSSSTAQTDFPISLRWASFVPTGHTSKITAELGADYAPGIVCKAALTKPTGSNGTSTDYQALSTDAVDMLTGIGNENCTGATITYAVSLSEKSALPTSETVTVIWTITDADGSNQDKSHYLGRRYYVWEGF